MHYISYSLNGNYEMAYSDRARRVIEENMLNPNTFCGEYGIRSLSRLEKMFVNWP